MEPHSKMALLNQCPEYKYMDQVRQDLAAFLTRNGAVEASVVSISFSQTAKYNVI